MKQNITLTVEPSLIEIMREYYASFMVNNEGEYVDFQAEANGVIITAFTSKKSTRKVTFFGEEALKEA